MKCLHCGSEVSMWATVCPYCHRNPGNILEHIFYGLFKWITIFSLIVAGIAFLFSGNSSDKSTQPVNEQSVKTQQSTEEVKQTEQINYIEDTGYKNKEIQQLDEKQQENKEQNNSSEERDEHAQEDLISPNQAIYNNSALSNTNRDDVDFEPYLKDL